MNIFKKLNAYFNKNTKIHPYFEAMRIALVSGVAGAL